METTGFENIVTNTSGDWEKLKKVAEQEVKTEFASKLQAFEGTPSDKIFVLLQMMNKYAEMIPDTNQPIENSKRFHVEEVAKLIKRAELDETEQEINKLIAGTV